jgi:hypothetical protein
MHLPLKQQDLVNLIAYMKTDGDRERVFREYVEAKSVSPLQLTYSDALSMLGVEDQG